MGSTEPSVSTKDVLPLALLAADPEETVEGITRFQKLIFLLQNGGIDEFDTLDDELSFTYEAHNYGPYSRELHDRLDTLVERDLVSRRYSQTPSGNDKEIYELKGDGMDVFQEHRSRLEQELDDPTAIRTIATTYGEMPLLELLDRVYEAYPDYTTESVL